MPEPDVSFLVGFVVMLTGVTVWWVIRLIGG